MKISIFERCNPFSHKPGTRCLIPGTREVVSAFPAKINDEFLDVEGPVKEWTVFQDLERARIQIRGRAKNGMFTREIPGISLPKKAKLSFGAHKAQVMEKVIERCDPAEFLPLWHALAQYYPAEPSKDLGDCLLGDIQHADRLDLFQVWKNLFHAGFSEWMIPRALDEGYHGFAKAPINGNDPFVLFTMGITLIQEMIVRWDGAALYILPRIPPELHCGRLVDVHIPGLGMLSVEWSKKEIKKMIVTPEITAEISIVHPKRIQGYRVKSGNSCSRQTIDKPLQIEKDVVLFFDQFQH